MTEKERAAEEKADAIRWLKEAFAKMRTMRKEMQKLQEEIEWLMDMATYEYEEEEEEEEETA